MKLDTLLRPPPDALRCPRCATVLEGPRVPGFYRCKPCGASFWLPGPDVADSPRAKPPSAVGSVAVAESADSS